MDRTVVEFQIFNEKAKFPIKGSSFAAGIDIFACESVLIPPGTKCVVSTGLGTKLPKTRVVWYNQDLGCV